MFSGRGARLLDSFFPLLVFLIANALIGLKYAIWGAVLVAVIIAAYRLLQRDNPVYSLGGLGGVLLAAVFVNISGSEGGFFLPGLISGAVTVVLCVVSATFNRPLVAWSSFIVRRWPLDWYWHPRVLPAYNEVTIIWGLAFAARLGLELWIFQLQAFNTLGTVRILLGWPFTVALLIASYLYGIWRLGRLKGPSVEEFRNAKAPPWVGQTRGF